jgi:hypothetical protein
MPEWRRLGSVRGSLRVTSRRARCGGAERRDEPVRDEPVRDEPVRDEPVRDEPERAAGFDVRRVGVPAERERVADRDEPVRRVLVAARRTCGAFLRTGRGGGVRRLMALRR